ncbi:MAG: hypothetical protein CMH52_11695 [Myxococcales bacterium]|nr:hypothetical protein [Myxococcales bacterium]
MKLCVHCRLHRFFVSALLFGLFWTVSAHADSVKPSRYSLDDLLRAARASSPVMTIARAKLKKYEAIFDRAYYAWSPVLKIDALMAPLPERRVLDRCVDPGAVDPMTGLAPVIACPGQNIQTDERITADTEIGLLVRTDVDVTFPIYTFGKIEHGQKAARAGIAVGKSGINYARGRLDFLVKKAYYGAQMAETALGVLKEGRKRFSKAKRSIEKELAKDTGRFTSNDLRKLLVDEAELESRYLETEALNKQAWSGIRLAASVAPTGTISLDTLKLKPVSVERRNQAEYIELALDARPDIRMARAAIRARQSEVNMAIANFLPDIALVGGLRYAKGTTADDPVDPFANDGYNYVGWGVVIGAKWKIDYSVLVSRLKEKQAKALQQRAEYDALVQQVRLEMVTLVSEMERRKAETDVRRIAMKAGKAWLISNTLNFGLGVATVDQLLRSLIAYSKARLTYYRVIYEYNLAVARLSQAVGIELSIPNPNE